MTSRDELLFHMRKVQAAERDMRELSLVWQTIESAAAISCPEEVSTILPTLTRTRERFGSLQLRLIDSLASENRAELGDELSAKAQCAIDILVRNLYERTADVGFLATDEVIRAFCASDEDARDRDRPALRARLAEYQSKYTVYDDVIVLGQDGAVLARLDDDAELERSADPLVAEALGASAFRERFGRSDLIAGGAPALLYAHRITQTDGRPLGVLVLSFRFVDEMQRIFTGMADERLQTALMLIDDQQRVIATNDESHVALGANLKRIDADEVVLTTFAGREYLAVTCATRGYQGYMGPAWRAQAMVSLLTAFRPRAEDETEIDVPLDNPQLTEIQYDADEINRELRRVVWNGQLMAQSREGDRLRLKAVLNQVNVAGHRTRGRVSIAVRDLYRTSLARARHQADDLARLAADIMDRNLYERANDCRWWALSPAIAEQLAQPPSEASGLALGALLDRVNGLYTVYSRLVVFDTEGRVRGASRAADEPGLLRRTVDRGWLDSVRRLTGRQQYAVSDFAPTDFHDAGDTYVYLAAIRDPGAGNLIGGIAVVFNSAAEFGAMLADIIGERRGFAAFVEASGRVVAASDPELAAGAVLSFAGDSAVVEHQGASFACARARAGGYREFKASDGYDNGVQAVVGLRLGPTDRRRRTLADEALVVAPVVNRETMIELGVFQVGGGRYGLPAEQLLQAVSQSGLRRAPSALTHSVGLLEVQTEAGAQMIQVICARRLFGVNYPARHGDGVVLVMRSQRSPHLPGIGLRVDDVLSVLEVEAKRVHEAPAAARGAGAYISGLVDCDLVIPAGQPARRALVQVVDPQALIAFALGAVQPGAIMLPGSTQRARVA
jgi:chemotaxis signal transduction protein